MIFVNEAGSRGKFVGKIKIEVDDRAKVCFNKVYEETHVIIGGAAYIFEEDMTYYNDGGR